MNDTQSKTDTHGTLETLDDAYALRFERHLSHPVDRVWRAITEPEELRHWYPGVPDWKLEQGATFESDGLDGTGKILELEPPRVLEYSWGAGDDWDGDVFRFELTLTEEGCILVFTHRFSDRRTAARDGAGWELCFERLDALLAGAPIGEAESLEGWPELHERYASELEVDPKLGREAFAGHPSQS